MWKRDGREWVSGDLEWDRVGNMGLGGRGVRAGATVTK